MSAKLVLRYIALNVAYIIKNDDFFEIKFLMFFNVVHNYSSYDITKDKA